MSDAGRQVSEFLQRLEILNRSCENDKVKFFIAKYTRTDISFNEFKMGYVPEYFSCLFKFYAN